MKANRLTNLPKWRFELRYWRYMVMWHLNVVKHPRWFFGARRRRINRFK